jgi:putative spermidine/putrescine transport system permease protein
VSRGVKITTWVLLVFVSLPTLIVIVSSFSGAALLSFPPSKLSLAPYGHLFSSGVLRPALLRSLAVGIESASIAMVFGLPTAIGLVRLWPRVRGAATAFLTLGFATPFAVSAVAFLVVYYDVGMFGSLFSLSLALSIINFPCLLYSVLVVIQTRDDSLEDAAATLGASPGKTFLFITIPGLAPGIITGTLLVFVFGITDFLVSLVLTTVETATLPVTIYGSLRSGATPLLAAAGGCYVLIALFVVMFITRMRSLEQFLYRAD